MPKKIKKNIEKEEKTIAPAPIEEPELELDLADLESNEEPIESLEKTIDEIPTKIQVDKKIEEVEAAKIKTTEATEKKVGKPGLLAIIDNFLGKFGKIPVNEKIFFAENLRVMVKSGLSMSEALDTISLQTRSKKFKTILLAIKKGVLEGNTLSDMLTKYPKVFPEFFINMIRVGEVSGNLEKNLEELSNQMKKDHDLVSKVRGAMIYPIVIVIATIGIGIVMFIYVIPNVLSIFEEIDVELPLATRLLIAFSNVITEHGIVVLIVSISVIIGIVLGLRTKKGKKMAHFLILNAWILGPIAKKINLARFSRTLSSLLKTDIRVIDSFKITSSVLNNVYYKEACLRVSRELAKGITINSILKDFPKLFPPLVTQMISVGEKSGTLDELLGEVAVFYEREVEDITKNLSSIIEPILIVFLGAVVGFIAFAVISPIYTLSENL